MTGRRGVGKSTTLAVLQQRARQDGSEVIFVDVETHKDRAYPDVLIEIILDILEAIRPKLSLLGTNFRLRREIKSLIVVLKALRDSAPEVTRSTEEQDTRANDIAIQLTGGVARRFIKLSGKAHGGKSSTSQKTTLSSYTRKKEEFLRDLAPSIASVLQEGAKAKSAKSLLVVLDDFYFVARKTQPLVLDHLHGMTKRSNVWLKIGSVQSRTQTFADGDPPKGMQPPHDVQHLSLDVGLADFRTAQTFLEQVAGGVLTPAGFNLREVLTETARERAVLIAGGAVARDYFDLLITAADVAWERAQRAQKADEDFTINAENVQAAAGLRLERKQNDLRNDAGRDAPALEARFSDLVKFARDRDTYFFLVRRELLDSGWGKEIVELEDLRFVHRIMTTRPNTQSWRGVDTVVFMLDIPALVRARMRKAPVEFWKPGQSDALRQAGWVYSPEWDPSPVGPTMVSPRLVTATPPRVAGNTSTSLQQEQLPLDFDQSSADLQD